MQYWIVAKWTDATTINVKHVKKQVLAEQNCEFKIPRRRRITGFMSVCVYLVNPIKWCFTPLLPINLFAVTIFLVPHFVFTVLVNGRSGSSKKMYTAQLCCSIESILNSYGYAKTEKSQKKTTYCRFITNWNKLETLNCEWVTLWTPPQTYTREYGMWVCVHLCNKRKLNIFVEIIKKNSNSNNYNERVW